VEFRARFEEVSDASSHGIDYRIAFDFSDFPRPFRAEVAEESIEGEIVPPIEDSAYYGTGLALFPFSNYKDELKSKLKRLSNVMGNARLYRLDPRTMAAPAALDVNRKFRLDEDGFGLATLLDDILGHDPRRYLEIRDDFCRYFPQIKEIALETGTAVTRETSASGIRLSKEAMGKGIRFETLRGKTIRAQQASDGAILYLGLLALMNTPDPPKLILLEEPEKGIYPKRFSEVVDIIRAVQTRTPEKSATQIILTTHSPYLLSAFQPEEVTLLSRENGTGPVRARGLRDAPHIHERLNDDEFYLGELWYNLSEDELFADA
jgi:predicted ATPase